MDTLMQTPEDLANPYCPGGLLRAYPLLDLLTNGSSYVSSGDGNANRKAAPTFYGPSGEVNLNSNNNNNNNNNVELDGASDEKNAGSAKEEVRLLKELLTSFKQPLYTHSSSFIPSSAPRALELTKINATTGISVIEESVTDFVNMRRTDPLCASVTPKGMEASLTNEKLLWKLVMIALKCNGTLRSSSGVSKAASPEAQIVRALLDLESPPAFNALNAFNASAPTENPNDDVARIVGEARAIHKRSHGSAKGQRASSDATQRKDKANDSSSREGMGTDTNPDDKQSEEMDKEKETNKEKAIAATNLAETEAVAVIESLLVLGKREEAVSHALAHQQWFLALMISSTCAPTLYQSVVSTYANQNVVNASTLHSLLLLYSNQGQRGFGLGGDPKANLRLSAMPGTALTDISTNSDCNDLTSLKRSWRRNLAALLSNKPPEWQVLIAKFAERLYVETSDIFAAHAAMLATGILPGASGDAEPMLPYTLLGSTIRSTNAGAMNNNLALLDVTGLQAMRMTEVIEWALSSGAACPYGDSASPQASKVANGGGSGGGFLSSFFGGARAGSSKAETADNNATATSSSASAAELKATLGLETPPEEVHAEFKLLFCRQKLRLCITLAEMGLMHEAYSYLIEIKNIISFIGARTAVIQEGSVRASSGASGANGPNAQMRGSSRSSPQPHGPTLSLVDKILDQSFRQSLDIFADRLSVAMKSTRNSKAAAAEYDAALSAGAAAGTTGGPGSGGIWSALSTLAAPHLKNLVNDLDPHAKFQDQPQQQQKELSPFGSGVAIGAPKQPTGVRATPPGGPTAVPSRPTKDAVDVDEVFGGGDIGEDWAHINHGNGNRGNASVDGHGTGLLAPPSGSSNTDALMKHGQDAPSVPSDSTSNDVVGELSSVPLEHEYNTWNPPTSVAADGSGLMASDYSAANTNNPYQAQTNAVFAIPNGASTDALSTHEYNKEPQNRQQDYTDASMRAPVGGSGLMAADYTNGNNANTDTVFAMPTQNLSNDLMGDQDGVRAGAAESTARLHRYEHEGASRRQRSYGG